MTDKELADAVVALGVITEIDGGYYLNTDHPKQFICDRGPLRVCDDKLIADWRVAGALMERMDDCDIAIEDNGEWSVLARAGITRASVGFQESLPRAIIEACVEALK